MSFLNALFLRSRIRLIFLFCQSFERKDIRLHSLNSVIPVPPPTEGNLIPWTSVRSVVTTPLPCGVLAAKRLITFWREDGRGSVRPLIKKEESSK